METTTFEHLVNTLQIQSVQKRDYIVPANKIEMETGRIIVEKTKGEIYAPNSVFHEHLWEKLSIPATYYKRMREAAPELLDHTVTKWLSLNESKLMLRTFESNGGNIARGLLSDRYAITDNYEVLLAALEAIQRSGIQVKVEVSEVTDKKMYVYITAPEIEVNAEKALRNYLRDKGDAVGYGIVSGLAITNSEVGYGRYCIRPRAKIIRCNNGLIVSDDSFAKTHLGAKMDEGIIQWSRSTQLKNRDLILAQTRDAIRTFLSKDYLKGIVKKIEVASEQKLDNPMDTVTNVVKEVSKKVSISDERERSILNYFMNSGDTHASGVFQSLTFAAQSMNPDDRNDMETLAFDLLPRIKSFDKPSKN